MKTIGRKVLSLLFALALVATMYTPAFSLYETSDVNFEGTISPADLSDMTLQEVRGLNYTAAELQDQIDTAKANKRSAQHLYNFRRKARNSNAL